MIIANAKERYGSMAVEMDLISFLYSFSSKRLLRGLAIVNLLFAPLLLFLRNPPAKHQILQNEDIEGIIY